MAGKLLRRVKHADEVTFSDFDNPWNFYLVGLQEDESFVAWLRKNKLLAESLNCEKCEAPCRVAMRSGKKYRYGQSFRCTQNASHEYSILKNSFFFDTRDANTLIPIIQHHVAPGATIYTDGWRAYGNLNELGYRHFNVIHRAGFVKTYENDETGEQKTSITSACPILWDLGCRVQQEVDNIVVSHTEPQAPLSSDSAGRDVVAEQSQSTDSSPPKPGERRETEGFEDWRFELSLPAESQSPKPSCSKAGRSKTAEKPHSKGKETALCPEGALKHLLPRPDIPHEPQRPVFTKSEAPRARLKRATRIAREITALGKDSGEWDSYY
ncbi:hypothetical protein BaRGS_00040310, partial [Batillaria attramentaria]